VTRPSETARRKITTNGEGTGADQSRGIGDYLALGALPPRYVQPRDLRIGAYRGGDAPEDLFVKLKNGIAGTTMTSVATQLSDDDTWHLVAYARSLPSDPLSCARK